MVKYFLFIAGITHSSVFIHPFSLVGGVLHTLTLTTWTPRSHHNQTVHRFLSNLPPYGGSCSLEPSEGTENAFKIILSDFIVFPFQM